MFFRRDAIIPMSGSAFSKGGKNMAKKGRQVLQISDERQNADTVLHREGLIRGVDRREDRVLRIHRLPGKTAGASKCRAFYARPYRSNDKAERERNHEFVRCVFPKGKSLDGLTQESVDSAFDNINSLVRAGKGDRTPSEAAERAFGEGFLKALGVQKIDKRKVRLTSLI